MYITGREGVQYDRRMEEGHKTTAHLVLLKKYRQK
jgi:hypothetical protein